MLRIFVQRSIVPLFAILALQMLTSSCGGMGTGRSDGGGGSSGGTTPLAFMYGASNTVTGLSINNDGSFTTISGSTFALPNGQAAVSIATVLNKFIYVIDGIGSLTGYSITRPNGALIPLTVALPQLPAGAQFMSDSLGRFLFAVTSTSVLTFTIDSSTGGLTQNNTSAGSPIAFATVMGLGVDSQGKLLVISNGSQVVSFNVAADGTLTATTPVSNQSMVRFALDPQAKFIYGVDAVSANVFGLAIGSDGTLSALAGFPIQTNAVNRTVIVRPGTGFVYVGEHNDIAGFTENFATGALTPIVQNPALTNQLNADVLAYDPSQKFLFANGTAASVLTDDKLTGLLTLNPNRASNIAALLNALISAAD